VDRDLGSLRDHDGSDWTVRTEADAGSATGEDVLADAVRAGRESLGGRLLAAYALGSLAHGGFSPLPLYLHYLDDHANRLTSAGRPELAEAFRQWRTQLIG
jgi:hypothetical protein